MRISLSSLIGVNEQFIIQLPISPLTIIIFGYCLATWWVGVDGNSHNCLDLGQTIHFFVNTRIELCHMQIEDKQRRA